MKLTPRQQDRLIGIGAILATVVTAWIVVPKIGNLDQDNKLIARSDAVTYCVGQLSDTRADAQLESVGYLFDAVEALLGQLNAVQSGDPVDLQPAADAIANGRGQVDYGLDVSAVMSDTRADASSLDPDPESPEGKFVCPATPAAPPPTPAR